MSEIKYVTKEQFDESIKALEKKIKKTNAQPRPPREPNDYNKFIKEQMVKIKKDNPGILNTQAFKKCAEDWNKEKESKTVPSKQDKIGTEKVGAEKDN
jgi:hypothetical protein